MTDPADKPTQDDPAKDETLDQPRYAKWQQPLGVGAAYLRLSIERWNKADGTLGWGPPDDPFPGNDNVKVEVFELDAGGEISEDDKIATFTGSFAEAEIRPWVFNKRANKYIRIKKKRKTIVFRPSGDPVKEPRVLNNPTLDVIWVNFLGHKGQPFRLEIPTHDGEFEGGFFEVAFRIQFPAMDGETEFVSRARLVRSREGVLLAVEPLPQFSISMDANHPHHQQILGFFHGGSQETKDRSWGNVVYKYRSDRIPAKQNTFGNSGCSIVSYTMAMRYLRDPQSDSDESIYDRRVAGATLAENAKPFKKTDSGFAAVDIPEHWWPVRMAWYARTKAKYKETLASDGKEITFKGSVQGYMHAQYGLIENQTNLNKKMGVTADVHSVDSKNWDEKMPIVKGALDRGLPVVALCSRGGKGGHYVVIVGYFFELVDGEKKIRFVLNDAGTSRLRAPARGEAGGIPIEALTKKSRELTKFRIFEPEGWDPSKHARFSPVLRRNPEIPIQDD